MKKLTTAGLVLTALSMIVLFFSVPWMGGGPSNPTGDYILFGSLVAFPLGLVLTLVGVIFRGSFSLFTRLADTSLILSILFTIVVPFVSDFKGPYLLIGEWWFGLSAVAAIVGYIIDKRRV